MGQIEKNLQSIQERIALAADRRGSTPDSVQLVAAAKGVPPDQIREAIAAGIETIGENRVQEASWKYEEIGDAVHWHMLGHLQTNKVGKALDIFEMVQSVDSYRLAEELSKRATKKGREVDILIEVNTSGEPSKFGIDADDAIPLLKGISDLRGIRIRGLMTLGLFTEDAELVRPCFVRLRGLRDRIEEAGMGRMELLSMGMSMDFEVAIEEGSNMVRIGTALFGSRTR